MPMNRKDYPKDWKAVSYFVRFKRAIGHCEHCGAEHNRSHPVTGSRVILTAAHLCSCQPLCSEPGHLKALCQRCHNRLDMPMRQKHAAETRRQKRIATGQTEVAL